MKHDNRRFHLSMGNLWTWMCIATILVVLISAQASLCALKGVELPAWVANFCTDTQAKHFITSIVNYFNLLQAECSCGAQRECVTPFLPTSRYRHENTKRKKSPFVSFVRRYCGFNQLEGPRPNSYIPLYLLPS